VFLLDRQLELVDVKLGRHPYLVNGKIPAIVAFVSDAARPYHHGDLRRALLDAAVELIGEVGPTDVSLRELARRVGVSHAAPAHHFGDKPGLLTAVAAEGFDLLADELGRAHQATGSFLEVGVAYVRFAVVHRPYFEVMFRPDLYRADDPAMRAAERRASELLYGPVTEVSGGDASFDNLRAGVAAWSIVHGLATLWLNGNLPPQLGNDPEDIARTVASYLFRSPASPPSV
jgi:AcrR family transcriptional regulator